MEEAGLAWIVHGHAVAAGSYMALMNTTTQTLVRAIANDLDLGRFIQQDDYIRERLEPNSADPLYLHLSDLRIFMGQVATDEPLRVLDFGCGGSPYRRLFPSAKYDRADVASVPNIDYVIPTDSDEVMLPIAGGTYDLILSSQVLEHVPTPSAYLAECRRLLRPGGRLVLTTHGIFEDHGCPYDYYRWTDGGLRKDIERAGFDVKQMVKQTTGTRAALFLLERSLQQQSVSGPMAWALWPLVYLVKSRPWWLNRQCDAAFPNNRVVTESLDKHPFYIGLGCIAERSHH